MTDPHLCIHITITLHADVRIDNHKLDMACSLFRPCMKWNILILGDIILDMETRAVLGITELLV